MEKEQKTKEKLEKLERVENLIDYVMVQKFCEDDTKAYLHYLDKDLERLQELKDKCNKIDDCLIHHYMEEIILLQQIIEIVKGVE